MTYYPDLTQYSYSNRDSDCLNVGWLEHGEIYSIGEVSGQFVEKLAWACVLTGTNDYRGLHECTLCPTIGLAYHSVEISGTKHVLGSAEIRIQGKAARYAAPNLILHYVVDHQYTPPEDFIYGVMALPDGLLRNTWIITRGSTYW